MVDMRVVGRIEPAVPVEKPFAKRTVKELLELAAERGISIPEGAKKDDILGLLNGGSDSQSE